MSPIPLPAMNLTDCLPRALADGELFLHYQPIVALATRRWVGAEALLRWCRPDGTMVCPSEFLPLAERAGLSHAITDHVLQCIRSEAGALFRDHPDVYLSINLCAADLETMRVAHALRRTIEALGIAPANLRVEATERSPLDANAATTIAALRAMGIQIAVDDFGTGYSNLACLTKLAVDCLKIDRLFIDGLCDGSVAGQVVSRINDLAADLNLEVVAEGVETHAQADCLVRKGIRFAQGWLFARAMPMPMLVGELDRQVADTAALRYAAA